MVILLQRCMSKSKIEHAQRNKNLSQQLFEESFYYDWSITTAFYSSIHLIESKKLPFNKDGITFTNLYDFKSHYRCRCLHSARLLLIQESSDFKFYQKYKNLYDKCLSARYTSYKVTKDDADKCLKTLDYIFNDLLTTPST